MVTASQHWMCAIRKFQDWQVRQKKKSNVNKIYHLTNVKTNQQAQGYRVLTLLPKRKKKEAQQHKARQWSKRQVSMLLVRFVGRAQRCCHGEDFDSNVPVDINGSWQKVSNLWGLTARMLETHYTTVETCENFITCGWDTHADLKRTEIEMKEIFHSFSLLKHTLISISKTKTDLFYLKQVSPVPWPCSGTR